MPEDLMLSDMHELANATIMWHENRMSQLKLAADVPDEVEIEVLDKATGVTTVMTPDQRVAFKAGIAMAIEIFQSLPFEPVEFSTDAPAEEPANV